MKCARVSFVAVAAGAAGALGAALALAGDTSRPNLTGSPTTSLKRARDTRSAKLDKDNHWSVHGSCRLVPQNAHPMAGSRLERTGLTPATRYATVTSHASADIHWGESLTGSSGTCTS